ncbi:MAG: hypothetical protein H7288_09120 [Kineosporiaceae bacterium]|nr:hypothetical protein [Aeromicrobium sp.]
MTSNVAPAEGGAGRSPQAGFARIIGATGIAGAAAYVVTWVVPRVIGGVDYKDFAVFWAAMYLVVTALSGFQQEITRATQRSDPAHSSPSYRARNFGFVASAAVLVVVIGTAPAWVEGTFPEEGWSLVFPLATGVASYVLLGTLSGVLYGTRSWTALAVLIVADAVLRLGAVSAVALVTHDTVALAWAAALPFLVTVLMVWPVIRKGVLASSMLDVGYRRLSWNIARTLVASTSMGAMVSGFPLILSLSSQNASPALLASIFLTVTLTRAPLIVSLMAIQGYLIVRFRESPESNRRDLTRFLLAIMAGATVLSVLGWVAGPTVFGYLFPGEPILDGWFFAALVLSSALVGVMCVAAPAALSRGRHVLYASGWLVAAIVTTVVLLVPGDLVMRTVLSLVLGPLAGAAFHILGLAASSSSGVRFSSDRSARS